MASRSIKNRPNIKKKHPFTGVLVALSIVAVVICAGIAGVWALGESWLQDLPDYEDADQYNTARKTEVYANDGKTLLAEFYLEDREPVELTQISNFVLEGTIATEDERFYDHGGFDIWGIARALVVNMTGSSREGASTITQQFVRNTILASEANDISIERKVREMYLSMKLEEVYSKDEILLMYLNTINYGSGAYGIQAASQRYFSKDATDLTLVEAATLIGIPQSPTYNNPIDNPDACFNRRNLVLERMLSNGYISQAEYDEAVATPLALTPTEPSQDGIYLYPYFTSYVREQLLAQYSQAEVFKGGMKVYTTIDPAMQAVAETAAANKESQIDDAFEVALTAVDPDTGYIKAMVGGKDYYANQYNLATQAQRQPGSSFKTFTLIAALEEGISPQTMINCSTTVKIDDWNVENINAVNYGTRSLSSAFAVSSNTGFARLVSAIGPEKVVDVAQRMGINKSVLTAVPSITLGAKEVTVTEMAQSYATIANGGTERDAVSIERIIDRNGNTIFDVSTNNAGTIALTPEISYAATQVMEGVLKSGGTGTDAALASGQPAAGKTGTSENYRDSWFCGFTPQLSVSIWLGDRRDQSEGIAVPSSITAASVFSEFAGTVLEGQPIEQFKTAQAPTYKSYSNTKFGIGGTASSDTDDTEKDTTNKNQTQPNNPTDPVKPVDPVDPVDPVPTPDPTQTPDPKPDPDPTPTPTPTPTSTSWGTRNVANEKALEYVFASPLAVRNDWISDFWSGSGISFRTISLRTA